MVLATLGEVGMGTGPKSDPEGLLRPEEAEASLLRSLCEVGVFGRFGGKEGRESLQRVDESAVLRDESGLAGGAAETLSLSSLARWRFW